MIAVPVLATSSSVFKHTSNFAAAIDFIDERIAIAV